MSSPHVSEKTSLRLFLSHSDRCLGSLPNPEKNEAILKSFAIYAMKTHQQALKNRTDSSILLMFKQAISEGITAKEAYALAVRAMV